MKNNAPNTKPCNCRTKSKCPANPDKVYLGTAEGDFKKRYHNHAKSFRNKRYTNDTSLSKYIWEIDEKHQENPSLKWSIVKRVAAYSNITKKCLFCLHKKLVIVN